MKIKLEPGNGFWPKIVDTFRKEAIMYQWDVLNGKVVGIEPNYTVHNFKAAAKEIDGEFIGVPFQDTDLAKWLEGAAYSLQYNPDPELTKIVDDIIETIARAQQPDGYLDTYYILAEPDNKWQNSLHELYCAGHMIEAGVAYYEGTGKRKLLEVACRIADNVAEQYGLGKNKQKGYIGHEGIELALVKLHRATNEVRYLELARFFILQRKNHPELFFKGTTEGESTVGYDYWGWDKPELAPSNLEQVAGHAVKAIYLYTGAADVAALTSDKEILEICRKRWDTLVNRQMYITGGLGATPVLEAFTYDYDLPNDRGYAETCASIALIFFAKRMLEIEIKSCYADAMERSLYNIIPASVSPGGTEYFYVNPLEVVPEAIEKDPLKMHVKSERQKWYRCACCPPNLLRLVMSLPQYIYTNKDTLYTHLYIANTVTVDGITLKQSGDYPESGNWQVEVTGEGEKCLAFRIPEWCESFKLSVNGQLQTENVKDGYFHISKKWTGKEIIDISMDMPPRFVWPNAKVRENAGKVAIMRGPVVYCIEEADNGENLSAITVDTGAPLGYSDMQITAKGYRRIDENEKLYASTQPKETPIEIKAIPYYMWCNRKPGEMTVWMRERNK